MRYVVLDSLLFTRVMPVTARSILDLGSGSGVPGVPLAIVSPDREFALLESRERRASFLAEVVRAVPLPNCRVISERAETAVEWERGRFDAVVIRCAGDPSDVLPVATQFAVAGGVVILSGPPKERPTALGRWIEVEGVDPGSRRRFLVRST